VAVEARAQVVAQQDPGLLVHDDNVEEAVGRRRPGRQRQVRAYRRDVHYLDDAVLAGEDFAVDRQAALVQGVVDEQFARDLEVANQLVRGVAIGCRRHRRERTDSARDGPEPARLDPDALTPGRPDTAHVEGHAPP